MKVLNLPNTITIIRILTIPLFITSVVYEKYDFALYLFMLAILTDVLDGLAARVKHQKTPLGSFLDPLADKFILVSSFILFSYYKLIPAWLTITILSRDIIVVTGWFILFFTVHTLQVKPLVLGKAAIALQFMLLCYVLLNLNFNIVPGLKMPLVWATAGVTILSGLHYIHRGFKISSE